MDAVTAGANGRRVVRPSVTRGKLLTPERALRGTPPLENAYGKPYICCSAARRGNMAAVLPYSKASAAR